jgi:hypothetical protein
MKSIRATRVIKIQKRNKNYYLFNNIDLLISLKVLLIIIYKFLIFPFPYFI